MKRILKFVAAILALVAVFLIFAPQVVLHWSNGAKQVITYNAVVPGEHANEGVSYCVTYFGVPSGLAGYIILGVGAFIILVVALVPVFRNHGILAAVVTGFAVIILIIATFFMFFLRKNFMEQVGNGLSSEKVYVGWGAIAAGSLGSLAAATGALSVVLDIAED